MQQDIEAFTEKVCRAVLKRTDDGRLIAGFQTPEVSAGGAAMFCLLALGRMLIRSYMQNDDSRNLLDVVNKDGQAVDILRLEPIHWYPDSGRKKPKLDGRDPFPAKIIMSPPFGMALLSSCEIVAEVFPRKVDPEAIDAASVSPDLVKSDGETQVDLCLQFSEEISQTKRFIAKFSQNLDSVTWIVNDAQLVLDYEGYCRIDLQKECYPRHVVWTWRFPEKSHASRSHPRLIPSVRSTFWHRGAMN